MKRTGFLFDSVVDFGALCEAARLAVRGRRGKPVCARLVFDLETEVLALQRELLDGSYWPRPYRTFTVSDPKPRTISAADIRDRVVHHALCTVLEPVFERVAIFDSYACRCGKGSHAALRRAREFSRQQPYFLKMDIRRFFETVDHAVLKAMVRRVVKDPRVLWLVDVFVDHGAPGSQPGMGLPIGNLTSQHFANFYLSQLDHFVKETLGVTGYIRYMDDLLLFGNGRAEMWQWESAIRDLTARDLRLEVKAAATLAAPVFDGVPFLGFRIWPQAVRLSGASKRRFLRGIRDQQHAHEQGRISAEALERSMASRVGHVVHADTGSLRRSVFCTEGGGSGATRALTG